MKSVIRTNITRVVFAVVLAANPAWSQSGSAPANANSSAGDLFAEARAVETQVAEREFRRCGQHFYTLFAEADNDLFEFDNVTFGVQKGAELSNADRLDGYQWRGLATYTYTAYRIYRAGKWTQWMPPGGVFGPGFEAIVKKNGEWMVDAYFLAKAHDGDEERPIEMFLRQAAVPPACDAVPN